MINKLYNITEIHNSTKLPSFSQSFTDSLIGKRIVLPYWFADEYSNIASHIPNIKEFSPNVNPSERMIKKFSCLSALIIINLIEQMPENIWNELHDIELNLKKQISEPHPVSHLLLSGVPVGSYPDKIPAYDTPSHDDVFTTKDNLAELFILGFNRALGFDNLLVPGEKGGLPVHHHVPIAKHSCSGTSVCFKKPIALHTEDAHADITHTHFYLMGVIGNKKALTPVWTVSSLLSCFSETDREWLIDGMKLPYLFRAGAGRFDEEGWKHRTIKPILSGEKTGRPILMINLSDYHNIFTDDHILRIDTLPPSMYSNICEYNLACRTLKTLRSRFADIDTIAKNADNCWPVCLERGDFLIASNDAPHARTSFYSKDEGTDVPRRYALRLYPKPANIFDSFFNNHDLFDRKNSLASFLKYELSTDQWSYLKRRWNNYGIRNNNNHNVDMTNIRFILHDFHLVIRQLDWINLSGTKYNNEKLNEFKNAVLLVEKRLLEFSVKLLKKHEMRDDFLKKIIQQCPQTKQLLSDFIWRSSCPVETEMKRLSDLWKSPSLDETTRKLKKIILLFDNN